MSSDRAREGCAMQINQDVTLQIAPALSAEVAAKTPLLEMAIGPSATEATWALNGDPGRPSLILRLRDREGKLSSSATFAPTELKNETELTARLSCLSQALLKVVEWRKAVEALFTRIRPWCASLSGGSYVKEKSSWVEEEKSGWYEVPELMVIRGSAGMVITPVGAWVLGADGRVDMIGPGDRRILHYAQAADSWYHIPNDAPYREIPFTEPLFRELAEACLDA
jgi:hypothetical protein